MPLTTVTTTDKVSAPIQHILTGSRRTVRLTVINAPAPAVEAMVSLLDHLQDVCTRTTFTNKERLGRMAVHTAVRVRTPPLGNTLAQDYVYNGNSLLPVV